MFIWQSKSTIFFVHKSNYSDWHHIPVKFKENSWDSRTIQGIQRKIVKSRTKRIPRVFKEFKDGWPPL